MTRIPLFKNTSKFIVFVFILSMGLRLTLAFLNREANDSHMEVINWILDKHELPVKEDCWQCYQLKFFHVLAAELLKIFQITNNDVKIIFIQLLNVLFGFLTLLFFWKYLKKYQISENIKIIVFSFFAFNPCLTGINVQITTDTLEILSGVLVIYFTDLLLTEQKPKYLIGLLISLLIAAMTKATGLVLFGIVVIVFILKIFSQHSRMKRIVIIKYFFIIGLIFLCVVPFAGGYYDYYRKNNSLPTSAWPNDPPPLFFESTNIARPGLRNMAEGYFTFRYFDMIRQPYINNESDNFPLHRTSVWSQLYGRTVFMHFDQWPHGWQTKAPLIINTGRILIILGIIPLGIFLLGFFTGLLKTIKVFLKNGISSLSKSNNYIHLITAVTFLLCSIKYSYDIRDFSAMKSIYIFPALLSFIKLFLDGYSYVQSRIILKVISTILISMIILSIFDIGYLIYQQYELRFNFND